MGNVGYFIIEIDSSSNMNLVKRVSSLEEVNAMSLSFEDELSFKTYLFENGIIKDMNSSIGVIFYDGKSINAYSFMYKPKANDRFSNRRPGRSRLQPVSDKETLRKTSEILSKMPKRLEEYAELNEVYIEEVDPEKEGYYYM